ncbi:hypothetical protein ACEPAF_5891 [Sanghuangporus sanghuang]
MIRIPREVLADVQLEVLLSQGYEALEREEWINTPLRISQVCRDWRQVAISDGRLWSHIIISSYTSSLTRRKNLKAIFDTWIARANRSPLYFTAIFYENSRNTGEESAKLAVHIIKALLSRQHQWKDARCVWSRVWSSEDAPVLRLNNMPALTCLYLRFKLPIHASIYVGKSPKLKWVDLEGNFDILAAQEPAHSLTFPSKLTFRGINPNESISSCLNFLSAAPFLKELHIDLSDSAAPMPTSLDNFIVHGLRQLKCSSLISMRQFFDNLTLPSLESLEYVSGFEGEILVSFLRRSSPPLTFLDIDHKNTKEDAVIEILRLIPTLKDFRYIHASVSSRFFRELQIAPTRNARIVCPVLETLVLQHVQLLGNLTECTESLICMLESRADIMESFRVLRFGFHFPPTVEVSELRDFPLMRWESLSGWRIYVSRSDTFPDYPFSKFHQSSVYSHYGEI